MPAPVDFTLSLAPLPVNFSGTPQEFATALVDRLTVAPTEPWSSFQNGGAIPTSDSGPVLYQSKEWRVWDVGTGAYTYHVQNGLGIVDGTIVIGKLATDVTKAKGVLTFNASGVPTVSVAGTNGWVLTQTAAGPIMAALPTPAAQATANYFTARASTSQIYASTVRAGFTPVKVTFDTVPSKSADVTFNTTTSKVTLPANSVWYLYASLQIGDSGTASTDVTHTIGIVPTGAVTAQFGNEIDFPSTHPTFAGLNTGGIVVMGGSDGDAYVSIASQETTADASGFTINPDVQTFFGGFRLL